MKVEITVTANKRESNELSCGVVGFDGAKYDYSKLTSHLNEVTKILESPVSVPNGYVASDKYGEHTVKRKTYQPFTFVHLLLVSDYTHPDGLYLSCDFVNILEVVAVQNNKLK
jgi:hypothetical protein